MPPPTRSTPRESPAPILTPEATTAKPSATPTPLPAVCSPLAVQPLEKIKKIVTQPFGKPVVRGDGTYEDTFHPAVDLGSYNRDGQELVGTPVLAALNGTIAAIIHDRPPYGNMIMLETRYEDLPEYIITSQKIPTGDSLYSLYAHLQNMRVEQTGQQVRCGYQLAETGLTGFTGGPHLHFETRWGPPGAVFPVMGDYRGDVTPDEQKYYVLWRTSGTYHVFNPLELLAP